MTEYTFMSNNGNFVTVSAPDEDCARVAAMYKLHGEPNRPWLPAIWTGKGLMLRGKS